MTIFADFLTNNRSFDLDEPFRCWYAAALMAGNGFKMPWRGPVLGKCVPLRFRTIWVVDFVETFGEF